MDRVQRNRSTEYKITFINRSREAYIYIGSMWVGRIMYDYVSPLNRKPRHTIFLQLPGMWGPVAAVDDIGAAKLAATEAIKRWFAGFTKTPEPPPEGLVRALVRQDKALAAQTERAEPPVARRERRVRQAPVSAPVKRISRGR